MKNNIDENTQNQEGVSIENESNVNIAEDLLKLVILKVLEKEGKPLQQSEINRRTGIVKFERAKENGNGGKDWVSHYILKILESEKKVEQTRERGPWKIKKIGKVIDEAA